MLTGIIMAVGILAGALGVAKICDTLAKKTEDGRLPWKALLVALAGAGLIFGLEYVIYINFIA